jgi:hypothetical protein
VPGHGIRDARQDDPAGAGGYDPQFVTRPEAGSTEGLDGNRRLMPSAQPRPAAHPHSLFCRHQG